MPGNTPHFHKPPVVETVLSVQFDRLNDFRAVHFGLLWEGWRKQFPRVEEQPPLPPFTETFGGQPKLRLENVTRWTFAQSVDIPRVLFRQRGNGKRPLGSAMIQVQSDRFIHNWARASLDDQNYPTYHENRRQFLLAFSRFQKFTVRHKIGPVRPHLAEVTYINRIPLGREGVEAVARRAFPGVSLNRSDSFLPRVESIFVNQSFPIAETRGRLHAHFKGPVLLETDQDVIDFRLTALVAPQNPDKPDVEEMLDLAHDWLVNGFKSITSRKMHRQWEVIS